MDGVDLSAAQTEVRGMTLCTRGCLGAAPKIFGSGTIICQQRFTCDRKMSWLLECKT
jgi:hypothetical protein